MALKGDLAEFTVEHVLRLLELSGQTGMLDVRGVGGKASIEITGGAVSNVRGADDPEIALGRAILAREGTFAFKAGATGERAIDAPLDELIERSRAKATEAVEIEAAIPDDNVRFRLSDRATSGSAFALHYMPATAQPEEASPPAAPKRRGLFDFVLRRPSTGEAAQPEIDVPSPADLASLANALYTEYKRQAEARSQLGSHAERSSLAFEETLMARLGRVYELRAVGSRIPLRGDAIDVDAIRTGDLAPARTLPYLALLVRDLRDEAIRAFGAERSASVCATSGARTVRTSTASGSRASACFAAARRSA